MKRMEVHLDKGSQGVTIHLIYSEQNDEHKNSISYGKITLCIDDYENLLKALNKARKYVHNPKRKDHIMIPFTLDKGD